ncbi:IS1595 family transposase [Comamonas odontotermitis]|uniref:IS1595 family transposase n=1 Tax=Comamonas odontotermitis TaxID=379895 RepID=UPI00366C54D8
MDSRTFGWLLTRLQHLTPEQRMAIERALHQQCGPEQAHEIIQSRLEGDAHQCPHCAGTELYRHGQAHGLPRYRCVACGKTFNALTGTPLARLRLKSKWLDYLQCMLQSQTIRQAARTTGVHRNTSFRWRHRFLQWLKDDRPAHLSGITEVDETYLLESHKGERSLRRAARRRGGSASKRGLSKEHVCVLIARDRMGQTLDFVTGNGSVSKAQLREHLQPVLYEDALLVSDSNAAYRYFAADASITHEAVNLSAGVRTRGAFHVQNVNAYHSRLRQWLYRFHSVATRYLPNYLGWRRALDAHRLSTPQAMLLAAIGVFPHSTET